MTNLNASSLAAQAERDATRVLLGDRVATITGRAAAGVVTDIRADGTLTVTDPARRSVTVAPGTVVIVSSIQDAADELTAADMRRMARFLPPGARRRDADLQDWATAVAVARIAAVTE
jgi:hypothetical protein